MPVARGFATWGTDSGHEAAKLPEIQAFALNDEALVNYAYASYKKTRDVGRQHRHRVLRPAAVENLLFRHLGRRSRRPHDGAAFPADFDGIVSVVPVINWTGLQSAGNRSGIVQQNGGWLNPAKVTTLRKAVNAACDAMDGLADGIISAYEKCVGVFDAKTLRCPNGTDAGDSCLSDAQIAAVETLHRPFEFGFPLANGVTSYPGWNYGSEDQPGGMIQWVTGSQPAQFPLPSPDVQGIQWYFGNGAVRYFFARDAKFNPLRFSPVDFADRIRQVSALVDSTDPDLSAFLAHGGKLILKENTVRTSRRVPSRESTITNPSSPRWGKARADQFIRFYVTPGVNHGGEGVTSSGAAVPSKGRSPRRVGRLGRFGQGPRHAGAGLAGDEAAVQGPVIAADVPLSALSALQRQGRSERGVELHLRETVTAAANERETSMRKLVPAALLLCAAFYPAHAADGAAPLDLQSGDMGWIAINQDLLDPPSGAGPVKSDPAHPFVPNGRGAQPKPYHKK